MSRLKELYQKSKQHHALKADMVSYAMYKLGYGDINLAGANSRYKSFTELEKEFKKQIGKTDFPVYNDDRSEVVWICWLQGKENAPELVQNCLQSIEYHLSGKTIIYITADNFADYCTIPDYIIQKWKDGIITNTHFSDILRLALLTQHGGLWLDATVYMTGPLPAYITDGDFFVYRDGFFNCDVINFGSWVIYAKPNNRLLNETLALLYRYWQKYGYMKHYFLLHLLFRLVTDDYPEEWKAVPYFSQMDQHIFMFEFLEEYNEKRFRQLCSLTPIHKLTTKSELSAQAKNSYYSKLADLYKTD